MEDLDLICEYYSNLERQGPGSTEITIKALSFIEDISSNSTIADIGCGTGGQTVTLAKSTQGFVTGIDLFPRFIDTLNENALKLKFQNKLKGIVGSMENLSFKNEELDLIWSEGAIYNIGFQRGLNEWNKFLKKGGYIAVSEVSWFTKKRPDEINNYWNSEYPEINTIPNKLIHMQEAGFAPIACFVLPKDCWTKNFYEPQVLVQENFLKKHSGNKEAEELVKSQKIETDLYYKYSDYYGYAFYIGKKI